MRFTILSTLILFSMRTMAQCAGFASSDNFVVLSPSKPTQAAGQAFAEQVLSKAEMYRRKIAIEWLEVELPPSVGRSVINVQFSETEDSGFTWAKDHDTRKFHNIYLNTSEEGALGATLAHEIAHVVLATQYPHPRRLPAWIEEGIASKYDDASRDATRRRIVAWFSESGNWPKVDDVVKLRSLERHDRQAYALSCSVVDFLLSRGDKQRLLDFAVDGSQTGWDDALREWYGFRGFHELESVWKNWAAKNAQISDHNPQTRTLFQRGQQTSLATKVPYGTH